jgi:hypothetical protein
MPTAIIPVAKRKRSIASHMRWTTVAGVAAALAVLAYGTVLVFLAFDRNSHSASDTIRPFVITMGPVWVLAIWSGLALLRKR